jgi:hypothetical protein
MPDTDDISPEAAEYAAELYANAQEAIGTILAGRGLPGMSVRENTIVYYFCALIALSTKK